MNIIEDYNQLIKALRKTDQVSKLIYIAAFACSLMSFLSNIDNIVFEFKNDLKVVIDRYRELFDYFYNFIGFRVRQSLVDTYVLTLSFLSIYIRSLITKVRELSSQYHVEKSKNKLEEHSKSSTTTPHSDDGINSSITEIVKTEYEISIELQQYVKLIMAALISLPIIWSILITYEISPFFIVIFLFLSVGFIAVNTFGMLLILLSDVKLFKIYINYCVLLFLTSFIIIMFFEGFTR